MIGRIADMTRIMARAEGACPRARLQPSARTPDFNDSTAARTSPGNANWHRLGVSISVLIAELSMSGVSQD